MKKVIIFVFLLVIIVCCVNNKEKHPPITLINKTIHFNYINEKWYKILEDIVFNEKSCYYYDSTRLFFVFSIIKQSDNYIVYIQRYYADSFDFSLISVAFVVKKHYFVSYEELPSCFINKNAIKKFKINIYKTLDEDVSTPAIDDSYSFYKFKCDYLNNITLLESKTCRKRILKKKNNKKY